MIDEQEDAASAGEPETLLNVSATEEPTEKPNDDPPHIIQETDTLVPEPQAVADNGRPAYIEDRFFKDGKVDVEGLAGAYKELRSFMDSGKHKAPKDGQYDLTSIEELDAESPLLEGFLSLARDKGLSQDAVEDITRFFVSTQGEEALQQRIDRDEEMKKLGPNGRNLIKLNEDHLKRLHTSGILTKAELEEAANMTQTATALSVMNKLRMIGHEPTIPGGSISQPETITVDDISNMVADAKYANDPAYRKMVERKAYEAYGEAPPA